MSLATGGRSVEDTGADEDEYGETPVISEQGRWEPAAGHLRKIASESRTESPGGE